VARLARLGARDCLGEPQTTPEAVPLWTPLERIPWDEMWSDDRTWLPLLLEGSDVDGRFLFDGDRLLEHAVVRRPHFRL
jgi:8-oxo-dGTP diphosphatase